MNEDDQKETGVVHRRVKSDALVVSRNDLAHASYSNDPNQEKLMYTAMIVIRKIELDSRSIFDPNNLIQITARNFGEITHSISNAKEESKQPLTENELTLIEQTAAKALQRIYDKFVPTIMKVREPGKTPAKVPMITYCRYEKESKSIFIKFAPEFYEYFYRVVADVADQGSPTLGYYAHEIKQIATMESWYSIRIYRMLIENKWKGNTLEMSIEDLKWTLDCGDKYKTIDNFKRRVLNPAIEEINELTNVKILRCENLKDGRVVVGLRFVYEFKESFRIKKIEQKLEKFKVRMLKDGVPYSDDGSHFKHPDRHKYVKRIDSFTANQIGFLISCPQFLNDYSEFYAASSGSDDERETLKTAKTVLHSLLKTKPELLNDTKVIDFDYYVYCQYKNGLLKLKEDETEAANEEVVKAAESFEYE